METNKRVSPEKLELLAGFVSWVSKAHPPASIMADAQVKRQKLLDGLGQFLLGWEFQSNKPFSGSLSPGCRICGEGDWSCLFINGLCNAHCFFCPQDRGMKDERASFAEEMPFDDPIPYLDYLERFNFRGVGFSGGETFLVLDKLVGFIEQIRARFGSDMYIWVYTNGLLANDERLARLQQAGIDELRFNLSAQQYNWHSVERARRCIPFVTVEIPTIPEDENDLKDLVLRLDEIGVDYLNLHQLVATRHNYRQLADRGYTFLPPLAFQEPPALESELVALSLMQFALENRLHIGVNYCSHAYKARYQNLSRRMRAAKFAKTDRDEITPAGYLRRVMVQQGQLSAREWMSRSGFPVEDGGDSDGKLSLPLSCLEWPIPPGIELSLRYLEADLVSETFLKARRLNLEREISLEGGKSIWLGTKAAAEDIPLNQDALSAFLNYRQGGFALLEKEPLRDLGVTKFERVEPGLQRLSS